MGFDQQLVRELILWFLLLGLDAICYFIPSLGQKSLFRKLIKAEVSVFFS